MQESINISWNGTKLLVKDNGCYEKRFESTLSLFKQALKMYLAQKSDPFKLNIFVGDCNPLTDHYSFSGPSEKNLIPDYVFDKWESVKIFNYDKKCDEMAASSKLPVEFDKLFWIGNSNTHIIRKKLINNFKNNNDIYFLDSGDWKRDENLIDGSLKTSGPFVSLEDHAKYKYLLDVRGRGYSGRFKLLMFLNRPIFYVERDHNEYFFYRDLKPFKHYIPIKSDLSNFSQMLEWARKNDKECEQIAYNAQKYAMNNLRTKNAIEYFTEILLNLNKGK